MQPRVREAEPPARGADGQLQQETLSAGAVVLRFESERVVPGVRVQRAPRRVEQQRVLPLLVRKDALGQAGDEDHVEDAAAHLLGPADEHLPEAPGGRVVPQLGQPLGQHVPDLAERHRPDLRHRPQLGQHGQHPLGMDQHPGRQRLQRLQPGGPRRLVGQRRQVLDHGQGEMHQVAQIAAIAVERAQPRGLRILAGAFLAAQRQLPREPVQAAPPAREPADDGGLHEQAVPFPRRAQGALDHGSFVGIRRRLRRGLRRVEQRRLRRQGRTGEHLLGVGGRRPARRARRRGAARGGRRNLGQREILGEPAGGQPLGGAGEQGKERPAGRIGQARAAGEPGRDARAAQRGLEVPGVDIRRPHQDGHAVEPHAARRLLQDAAGDLDALAPLAGGREERDVARLAGRGSRGRRRCVGGEQVAANAVQRRGEVRRPGLLDAGAGQPFQDGARAPVAGRDRGERARSPRGQRRHQRAHGVIVDGNVEQQQRNAARRARAGGGCRGGRPQQTGRVDQPRLPDLRRVAPGERGQLAAHAAGPRHPDGVDSRAAEILERGGQRPREAAQPGHLAQVAERAVLALLERRARGNRLDVEPGARGAAPAGELGPGELHRELPHAEAVQPEHRSRAGRDLAGEVVHRASALAHGQAFGGRPAADDEPPRRVEPDRGGGRPDDGYRVQSVCRGCCRGDGAPTAGDGSTRLQP